MSIAPLPQWLLSSCSGLKGWAAMPCSSVFRLCHPLDGAASWQPVVRSPRLVASLLVASLLATVVSPTSPLQTAQAATVWPGQAHLTLPHADQTINLTLRAVPLPSAFRALARMAQFNVVVDDSVTGLVTLDLAQVTVREALDVLQQYGGLVYAMQGSTLVVAHRDSQKGQSFRRLVTRVFPLQHGNAELIAGVLNQSVFADRSPMNLQNGSAAGGGDAGGGADAGGGGVPNSGRTATADFHTNSIIVVGEPADLSLAERLIPLLDQERQMKTWRLSQADAVEVAQLVATALFSDGPLPALILPMGGGGGQGGGGGGGGQGGGGQGGGGQNGTAQDIGREVMTALVQVESELLEEGIGNQQLTGSSDTGGSTIGRPLTLRNKFKQSELLSVSPAGAIIIPDTRLNTLTVLGTQQQLNQVDSLLPAFDRQLPQVAFEVALVEVTHVLDKDYGTSIAGTVDGKFTAGFNFDNNRNSLLNYTNRPLVNTSDLAIQFQALERRNQARILANPSIITAHDSEALINIVDEVIQGFENVVDVSGNTVARVPNIGSAGIILNLLPKVSADGKVNLRVSPTISFPQPTNFGDGVTLISRRELLAQQVTIEDGQSFIVGGLLQDADITTINKIPFISDLPVLGALARNTSRDGRRTELLLVITPHVLHNGEVTVAKSFGSPWTQTAVRGELPVGQPEKGVGTVVVRRQLQPMPGTQQVQVLHSQGSPGAGLAQATPVQLRKEPLKVTPMEETPKPPLRSTQPKAPERPKTVKPSSSARPPGAMETPTTQPTADTAPAAVGRPSTMQPTTPSAAPGVFLDDIIKKYRLETEEELYR